MLLRGILGLLHGYFMTDITLHPASLHLVSTVLLSCKTDMHCTGFCFVLLFLYLAKLLCHFCQFLTIPSRPNLVSDHHGHPGKLVDLVLTCFCLDVSGCGDDLWRAGELVWGERAEGPPGDPSWGGAPGLGAGSRVGHILGVTWFSVNSSSSYSHCCYQAVEKQKEVLPYFCTADSQTDAGRHQLFNNDLSFLFSTAWLLHH